MVADPLLKMDITQVGVMTSIFPIAYGFSKFVSGVLGARSSPRYMLAGGLIATAAVNVAFGFGSSMVWFSCFWALNGILQVRMSAVPLHAGCVFVYSEQCLQSLPCTRRAYSFNAYKA